MIAGEKAKQFPVCGNIKSGEKREKGLPSSPEDGKFETHKSNMDMNDERITEILMTKKMLCEKNAKNVQKSVKNPLTNGARSCIIQLVLETSAREKTDRSFLTECSAAW